MPWKINPDTGELDYYTSTGGGGGSTNLAYTPSPTTGVVVSDTGTDATILAADATNAGLMLASEKAKLAISLVEENFNYIGDYNNGALYTYDNVVSIPAGSPYGIPGQYFIRVSNPNNPGYPPGTPSWDLFDIYTGSPAFDTWIRGALQTKVTVVDGKGLSTEDYTTAEQTKLSGIATGAEVNVNADWNATSGDAEILNKPVIKEGVYSYEIHVSQVDGNDTTGTGAVLNPVASITKALTLITGNRRTIIIHPGTYTENPSITTQYTVLTTFEDIGGNTLISGTVSTSTGCSIIGLKMTNLTITAASGTGNVNILNSDVSGTITKNGSSTYTFIRFTDFGTANITGSGVVDIYGGTTNFLTVNNAGAQVLLKNGTSVAPVLTAGYLNIVQMVIIAAVTNGVTSAAGSILTIGNTEIVNAALTGVSPVVLNGFYSIFNTVFDKSTSTLVATSATGGSTNSIDYFQYINADKFIKQGGTSSQFLKADGSVDSTTYQNAITLTTTGTSGAATLVGSTLNVPQYSGATVPQSIINASLIFYSNNC